jgi:deoxyribose-phosphate aldolase
VVAAGGDGAKETVYDCSGATDEDLILMRTKAGEKVQIKAAGEVRNLDDLLRVMNLDVTRVGAPATEAILDKARRRVAE